MGFNVMLPMGSFPLLALCQYFVPIEECESRLAITLTLVLTSVAYKSEVGRMTPDISCIYPCPASNSGLAHTLCAPLLSSLIAHQSRLRAPPPLLSSPHLTSRSPVPASSPTGGRPDAGGQVRAHVHLPDVSYGLRVHQCVCLNTCTCAYARACACVCIHVCCICSSSSPQVRLLGLTWLDLA